MSYHDLFVEVASWADGKGKAMENAEHLGVDNDELVGVLMPMVAEILTGKVDPFGACISFGHLCFMAGVIEGREQKSQEEQ